MTRIEIKIAELIDWGEVRYFTDEIEMYISEMHFHRLDYTGDIAFSLRQLAELFEKAKERAEDEVMKEDDPEQQFCS
jgi:hypothetical protein